MAYGLNVLTSTGISQISDSNRFYRAIPKGTISISGSTPPDNILTFETSYEYRLPGNNVLGGMQLFMSAGAGIRISTGLLSYYTTSALSYTRVFMTGTGGNPINFVVADPLGWSADAYGLTVRGPDSSIVFSSGEKLLAIASILNTSFTVADVGVIKYQTFDISPYAGTPYFSYPSSGITIKYNNTTVWFGKVEVWLASSNTFAYRLTRDGSITLTGDFTSRPYATDYSISLGVLI